MVARCRRIFGQRRVGHAGTLDPDATGVLLVGLGGPPGCMRFLTALPKTYTTDIVLGTATSTLDASGEVLATYDMSHVTPDTVAAAAAGLTGEIEQVPPMVSAVKVGGRRLHELARQGMEVERPARTVTVDRFDTAPDPDGPASTGPRWCARRAPTSGCWPTTSAGRSVAGPTWPTCGAPASARSARPTCPTLDAIGPDPVLTPAQAMRDLDAVTVGRRHRRLHPDRVALDRVPLGAVGDGPWAMLDEAGSCWPSTRRPAGTGSGRPSCWPAGRPAGRQ